MRPTSNTIVFLTSHYTDYAKATVDAVSQVASAAGFGTLCVTGRELAPDAGALTEQVVANGIYRLTERANVAGLICESGMLGHYAGPEAVIRFLERFRLPCVSLGLDVPGIPSVVADDVPGMTQLMEHLLVDTTSQRFAFVRGLPGDMYSQERENIFRQSLEKHHRKIEEHRFVTGNYDEFDAYDAVSSLLRCDPTVDAIVAANDTMALSAARAAKAVGLSIPNDIIVSGFDDVPDATRLSPALTTVRQPLTQFAELGISKLLTLIGEKSGKPTDRTFEESRLSRVSSELIVRGSSMGSAGVATDMDSVEAATVHARLTIGMTGLKAPPGVNLRILADALDHTMTCGSTRLSELLMGYAEGIAQADTHWWSNLCHQIEELSRQYRTAGSSAARVLLVEAALARLKEKIWASEMEREFACHRMERTRSIMQVQISSSTGISEVLEAVDRWVAAFNPNRLYLVRYTDPAAFPRQEAELVRAFQAGVVEPVQQGTFATHNILPETFADQLCEGTLLLNPVYAGSEHFGYLMIDPEALDLSQVDSAARCIGNAMRSQHLIETLEIQAKRLQDANQELSVLANRDALTGLPNRLCFEQHLQSLYSEQSDHQRFALCFLDLDGFKAINDLLGHESGDALLRSAATRLSDIVKDRYGEGGFVARLGGDEFTVTIKSASLRAELDNLMSALLEGLSETHVLATGEVTVSASIGLAIYPDHGCDSNALLQRADAAMYEAKQLGKNRYVVSSGNSTNISAVELPLCPKAIVQDVNSLIEDQNQTPDEKRRSA